MPDDDYLSPPVQRAARLLRHIADGDAVTNMAETSRRIGINRTTLLRLLHTLEAERFIEQDSTGWRIGPALIGLASRALHSQDITQTATPVLARLAESLGLSAHLGVLDAREVVFLVRRTPNLSFASNIRVGSRLPAHAANMGRAILASMPIAEVKRLYARAPMPAATSHTPTTLAALLRRLEADRAEGLAWSEGHYEPGIASVAAAVRDGAGAPIAAINVSGPVSGFHGRRDAIGTTLRGAAAEISAAMGWTGAEGRAA